MSEPRATPPLTGEQLAAATIGPPEPVNGPIVLVSYDPAWPSLFARLAEQIRGALGDRVLLLEQRALLRVYFYGDTTLAWSRIVSTMFERGAVASMMIAFVGSPSFVACCNRAKDSPSLADPPHSSSGRAARRRFSVSRSISRTKTPSNKSMKRSEFLEPPQKNVTAWF